MSLRGRVLSGANVRRAQSKDRPKQSAHERRLLRALLAPLATTYDQ